MCKHHAARDDHEDDHGQVRPRTGTCKLVDDHEHGHAWLTAFGIKLHA